MTAQHIPVIEERLEIGKREVELGKVQIRKRIVEDKGAGGCPDTLFEVDRESNRR